jgi:hypothetical protein
MSHSRHKNCLPRREVIVVSKEREREGVARFSPFSSQNQPFLRLGPSREIVFMFNLLRRFVEIAFESETLNKIDKIKRGANIDLRHCTLVTGVSFTDYKIIVIDARFDTIHLY